MRRLERWPGSSLIEDHAAPGGLSRFGLRAAGNNYSTHLRA
jgi:hypothetical protein